MAEHLPPGAGLGGAGALSAAHVERQRGLRVLSAGSPAFRLRPGRRSLPPQGLPPPNPVALHFPADPGHLTCSPHSALQPSPGHPRHRPGFHASSSRSCSLLAPPLSLPGWLSPQRVAYTTLLSAGPAPCLSCQSAASLTGPSALPDATGRKHLLPSLSFGAIKHGRFVVSS